MKTLHYSEYEPAPSLRPFVLSYWEFAAGKDQSPYTHYVMPDGCLGVACGRHGSANWITLVGPSQEGFQVPVLPGMMIWGIRFWPDAAGRLLPLEPYAHRGAHSPLAEVLPDLASELASQVVACQSIQEACGLFDLVLERRLPETRELDPIVRKCIETMVAHQGQLSVGDLARDLKLSERQFQRRFRKAVGLTPKEFLRVRRLRSTAASSVNSDEKGWSRVAAEQGYADQAHLIREFSTLVGLPPTKFEQMTSAIAHKDVKP